MSLLQNSVSDYQGESAVNLVQNAKEKIQKDELTLSVKQEVRQESPMPEELKIQKRKSSLPLEKLLHEVIAQKGESDSIEVRRNAANELEIDGLSKTTLHSFLVKAEELGKNITYKRTLKVEITD